MIRTWSVGARLAVGLGFGLGLAACSGGTYPSGYYSSGQPFGGEDDAAASDEDGGTGIDLDGDGDGPPPPPLDGDGGESPPESDEDCCVGHESRGCDNKPVEQCVCDSDSWCCEAEWDQACAALIEQLGCGHCSDGGDPPPPSGDSGGDPPPPPGGTGGDPPPPPGGSGGGSTGGDDPPPEEAGDCCTDNGTPGCDDAAVESCVCMQDDYCCNTEWDALCVSQVDSFGCGTCGGGGGGDGGGGTGGGGGVSACCEQQPGAGCPDAAVQDCVCAVDDYCCSVFWDLTCVGEVESLSCGSCS